MGGPSGTANGEALTRPTGPLPVALPTRRPPKLSTETCPTLRELIMLLTDARLLHLEIGLGLPSWTSSSGLPAPGGCTRRRERSEQGRGLGTISFRSEQTYFFFDKEDKREVNIHTRCLTSQALRHPQNEHILHRPEAHSFVGENTIKTLQNVKMGYAHVR